MNHYNAIQHQRYPAIDLLRGIAIVCMMAYHFCFDLNQFGVLQQAFNDSFFWLSARAVIVTSFLILVGISLMLAQSQSNKHYWQRIIKLSVCAFLTSLASYLMFADSYIFFGILHFILAASLICRYLLNFDSLNLGAGVLIVLIGTFYNHPWFDQPLLQWIGLMTFKPFTEDYVPLFPWLGIVLIGLYLGRRLMNSARIQSLASTQLKGINAGLAWMGQRSLLIYMLHQPILMGLLWIFLH